MQIVCPECSETLSYESLPPRFCQFCGSSIRDVAPTAIQPSPQLAGGDSSPTLDPDRTVPPTSSALFNDGDATIAPSLKPDKLEVEPHGVGERVGPYQTTGWLGSGGMGSVWEAVESTTGRRVAIKRLTPDMAADHASLKRFTQEAQLAAKVSHPNVTFIYGTSQHQGLPFIAMELMPGETLEDLVEENGPLEVRKAADFILNVIDGLQAVHQQGMIHRDIKPSNCFVDVDGTVKIGDFGLSKSVHSGDANLTKTGTFMGTPSYASPEQIRGVDVDERTDQYSIGATLFFLLTGKTPYQGDATSMMAQIIGDPPPAVRKHNPAVPRDLDIIIQKTLAKSAEDRFESLEALKIALLPYASRFQSVADAGRRLAAYMIDQTLLQIVMTAGIMVFMIVMIVRTGAQLSGDMQSRYQIWSSTIAFVVIYGYYVIGEGRWGQTVGKWLMGLKLVDKEGQSAGLWRAAIRAALIPAGLGIGLIFAWQQYRSGRLLSPTNPAELIVTISKSLLLSFGPLLVCLVTMRKSNRLLGLHGLVSGTRVIRAASVLQRAKIPICQRKTKQVAELNFGPYQSHQQLGEFEGGRVYLAHDATLNRDVWIVTREQGQPPPECRMDLARPTRQRWLDGGCCEGQVENCTRWDAYEAVDGMPVQQMLAIFKQDHCYGFARLLRQLVKEMQASIDDQTLPERMGLSQVWIDAEGKLKLLDSRLIKSVHASDLDSSMCLLSGQRTNLQQAPEERAVELVQQLGDVMQRQRILPQSLGNFLDQLYQKPKTQATLSWADQELEKLETRRTRLKWDDRVGILAMTMGIEALAFSLVSAVIMLVTYYFGANDFGWRTISGVVASLALPVGLAVYYHGGFVFHVMGIRVTRVDGHPASAVTNAVRAALSWAPFFVLGGGMMLLMIFADASTHQNLDSPGTPEHAMMNDGQLPIVALLAALGSMVVLLVGVLFAVFSPKRGLVDYLLRTRLMPE